MPKESISLERRETEALVSRAPDSWKFSFPMTVARFMSDSRDDEDDGFYCPISDDRRLLDIEAVNGILRDGEVLLSRERLVPLVNPKC